MPLLATEYVSTPDQYQEHVRRLKPGDRLLLRPGRYLEGLRIHGLRGTADAPIRIEGPAAGEPAVFLGRESANTVSIRDSSHVAIRHLVLDGRNLPIDAVRTESRSSGAHDITLEHLLIVNHGYDQQIVGISVQSPAWKWTIRRNVIVGAGTGMYLGSSDGRHPFVHGVIEHNLVLDTIGYNLQVKHQRQRPTVAGLPVNDGTTIIRGNVFIKGDRSSRDRMARPNVLVGHFPASGPGKEDRYLIEGNIFAGNPAESLFQGEGNISLLRNIFINPHGDGIAVQPHHALPRRIEIAHNFIATQGFGLRVRGAGAGFPASLHDNETIDMSEAASHRTGDARSHIAAQVDEAAARWWSTSATDPASASGITALREALRLACGDRAEASSAPFRAETAWLCLLLPRP